MFTRSAAIAALIASFCLHAGQVSAANRPSCEELSGAAASQVLKEANEVPKLYDLTKCTANVLHLFLFIKTKYPRLEEKDFRVLFLGRPGAFDTRQWMVDHLFFPMNSRRTLGNDDGSQVEWMYHAVLEHNGVIFDLDQSENPAPLAAAEYLRTMFPDEFHPERQRWWTKRIHAFIFPGEEYLTLPESIVTSQEFASRALNFNQGIPLAEVPEALKHK